MAADFLGSSGSDAWPASLWIFLLKAVVLSRKSVASNRDIQSEAGHASEPADAPKEDTSSEDSDSSDEDEGFALPKKDTSEESEASGVRTGRTPAGKEPAEEDKPDVRAKNT